MITPDQVKAVIRGIPGFGAPHSRAADIRDPSR